ncbi:MAG: hypothetical protein R2849_10590 [Thermomicrobiales bacterium]
MSLHPPGRRGDYDHSSRTILDEALKLGDRIAIMRDGEIIQIATPAELVTELADDYVERLSKALRRLAS